MQVLQAREPRKMKALGRTCPNFNPALWDKASLAVVTAASLARAEANPELAEIYRENLDFEAAEKEGGELRLKRGFVEGSPSDKVWGVGMGFDDRRIDNRANWKGQNRLGKCHDEACLAWGRRRVRGGEGRGDADMQDDGDEAEQTEQ